VLRQSWGSTAKGTREGSLAWQPREEGTSWAKWWGRRSTVRIKACWHNDSSDLWPKALKAGESDGLRHKIKDCGVAHKTRPAALSWSDARWMTPSKRKRTGALHSTPALRGLMGSQSVDLWATAASARAFDRRLVYDGHSLTVMAVGPDGRKGFAGPMLGPPGWGSSTMADVDAKLQRNMGFWTARRKMRFCTAPTS
jgi:hypothetical protein